MNKVKKISISDNCGSASRNYYSKRETINETTTGTPSRVPTAEHDAKKWLFCPKLRTCWLHRHTQQQHFSIWNLRFINWRTKETSAYKLTLIIKWVSISFGSTQRFNFRSEWNDLNMTGARFTLTYLCSLSYPDKMTHRLVNIIVWLIYLVVSCFSWIHRFDLRISSNQQINTHQKHQESQTERRYSADCSTSTSTVTLL